MKSSGILSFYQGVVLIVAAGIGNIFVVITTPALEEGGKDGWISVLVSYLLSIIIGMMLVSLKKRFPNKNIVELAPLILGKFLGKIVGLYYVLGWWVMSGLLLREAQELVMFFLPETPPIIINLFFVTLVIYVMHKGFRVFVRTVEFFVPLIALMLVGGLMFIYRDAEIENVLPILEHGVNPVIRGLRTQFPYSMEAVLFMGIWLPYISEKNQTRKMVWMGMLFSGVLLAVEIIMCLSIFGERLAVEQVYTIFSLFRYIQIGGFLTGFDIIFFMLWGLSSYLELMVFCYQPVIGFAKWLNLEEYKRLILPMITVVLIIAMIPSNIVQVLNLDRIKNQIIILPLGLLIPILWIVAVIRKQEESAKGSN